jgi:hypothetical protein
VFRRLLGAIVALAAVALAAPAGAGAAPNIDRIFRGDDGSIVSFRVVGSKVYGFAEDPNRKRATVLTGTLNGARVTGDWYDVPKGTHRDQGDLELQVTLSGQRMRLGDGGDSFGPTRLHATEATGFPWPAPLAAGYQGLDVDDMTGHFRGDDGSRWWVRQVGEDRFVMVGEREQQLGVRPDYTSVVVAERAAQNLVAGTFADVRKGLGSSTGNIVFGIRPFRTLAVHGGRVERLQPVYSWDFDAFAEHIEDALDGKVVGYSYAIAFNGNVVRQGAGGWRTRGVDGWRPFTADTQSSTASTAKTITAAIVLDLLRKRGIPLDAKVEPYLPSCWKRGFRINRLTFRQLLTHRSRLVKDKSTIGVDCGDDPWRCLMRVVELGRTGPRGRVYNNYNFALLRILGAAVDSPGYMRALVKVHDCEDDADSVNRALSALFEGHAMDVFFRPVGIEDGFGKPADDHAYLYASTDQTVPGVPTEGSMEGAGAGRIAMSAPQFARFLSALDGGRYGTWLRNTMKTHLMGFDPGGSFEGQLGSYHAKNGGCPTGACGAQAVIFPHGVQAYVMVNSDPDAVGSLRQVLLDGYREALD